MTTSLDDLIAELLRQQQEIVELFGSDERPEARPPIDEPSLKELRDWWHSRTGESLPDSYAQFLQVCDGIEHFCFSYSLLGARDLLSQWYSDTLEKILARGPGFEVDPDQPPIMIGWDSETTTRVFAELRHARVLPTEPVVLEGDPGDMALHTSFGAFLEFRLEANRHTIAHLTDLRDGKVSE